jgi:hypothetical protein
MTVEEDQSIKSCVFHGEEKANGIILTTSKTNLEYPFDTGLFSEAQPINTESNIPQEGISILDEKSLAINYINNKVALLQRAHALEVETDEIGCRHKKLIMKLNERIAECLDRNDLSKAREYQRCLSNYLFACGITRYESSAELSCSEDESENESEVSDLSSDSLSSSSGPKSEPTAKEPARFAEKVLRNEQFYKEFLVNLDTRVDQKRIRELKFGRADGLKWTMREEFFLVVGYLKVGDHALKRCHAIKKLFSKELARFQVNSMSTKLSVLQSQKKKTVYEMLVSRAEKYLRYGR